MKRETVFAASKTLILIQMCLSAIAYVALPPVADKFRRLGFPPWIRYELAVAIVLGVVVLCRPDAKRLQEWAYAGFSILFVSAFLAHAFGGDSWAISVTPLASLAILLTAYFTRP